MSVHRRGRRSTRVVLLIAGVCVAVIASVLTVTAQPGPLDVAGDAVSMTLDELDPMDRPGAAKGVKLADPDSDAEEPNARRELPPAKSKQKCEEASDSDVNDLLGVESGTNVCQSSETRQTADALKAPPFAVADGMDEAPVPAPQAPTPEPTEQPAPDPTPSATAPTSSPEDPTPLPSDTPDPIAPSPSTPAPSQTDPADSTNSVSPAALVRPAVVPSASDAYLSPNWVEATTPTKPTASIYPSMAHDPVRNQTVLFGGFDGSSAKNETWSWSGSSWTKLTPAASPPARYLASMAWDPVQQAVVLFGGQNYAGTQYNDVWKWDGSAWTQLTPTGTAPSARASAQMAFDPVRGGLIVFGGTSSAGPRNDTWQLKANAWTQIQANGASGAPAARVYASMAYSQSTSQMLLYGGVTNAVGCPACTPLNDTWTLGATGTAWGQQSPTHSPGARYQAVATYDPGIGGVVLFGGATTNGTSVTSMNDTWAWTGTDWLHATGIASPGSFVGGGMVADSRGQVVLFGAGGAGSAPQTWTYDTALPLLQIEVEGASGGTEEDPIFYVGDSARVKISATNAGINPIETSYGVSLTAALQDTLLAAGTQFQFNGADISQCTGIVAALCGGVESLVATIANIGIPGATTRVGDFVATVAGTQRGCELIDIPALAASIFGSSAQVTTQITVCGGGLGLEDWWTYDTTDLGGGATASVNVANGNLVVTQDDSTPVQTPGRLALSLGRTYNSQDLMSAGGPLGAGWQFDIGDTGETAAGFGIAGLSLPNLQTVTQPLSIPYVDRDGTRHIFKLRSTAAAVGDVSLPIDLTGGDEQADSILDLLNLETLPFTLTSLLTGLVYTNLCIDQAYTGPPGSNMFMFRYIGVGASNACSNPAAAQGLTVGWSLVTPDRLRYDFNELGNLIRVTDPAGQSLTYTPGVAYGPTEISTGACGNTGTCPKITIDYDAGGAGANRHVKVTDSAGRVTSYVVTRDLLVPQLIQVWEPGNPLSSAEGTEPSEAYTYSTASTPCAGSATGASTVGQICSVTDAAGSTTKVAYTPAVRGADRVLKVTDRRGTTGPAATTTGLATKYTYHDDADYVTADMTAPSGVDACNGNSACQRIRYSDIDTAGRVGQVAEGSANDVFIRQTGNFWDGGAIASCSQPTPEINNNLCQTIQRAVPSNAPFVPNQAGTATLNGVTVSDQAVDYQYGNLGQMLRRKVLLDASAPWNDDNSSITTWGTHDQYFDANGDQRAYNAHVRGDGEVASSPGATNYPSVVNADNPLAYWRMDEVSGPSMADQKNTNNGNFTSGATLGHQGAVPGKALGTSATDYAAVVDPLTGFAQGTGVTDSDFTFESWIKTSGTSQDINYTWGSGSNQLGQIGNFAGGLPYVYLTSNMANNDTAYVYSTTSVADNQWHHIAYTYDGSGSANGLSIWVDGIKAPTVILQDTLSGAFSTATALGGLGFSGNPGSLLDEVAIYNKVLSPSRIRAHQRSGTGNDRIQADTLYGVTDQVQELSPRGNGASNWGDYLTTTRRDLPPDGQIAPTNMPAGNTICGDAERGNTGLACAVETPASAGVSAGDCTSPVSDLPPGSPSAPTSAGYTHTCTTYEYNAAGQRTKMRTPKAHSSGSPDAFSYRYYDDVDTCSGADAANCDLSKTVSGGGWLKAVVDPAGEKVIYAYDAAGNIARTWDRNASTGKSIDAGWSDANAPPSQEFSEQVNATPVTSDSLSVSNTALIAVNPDGTVSGAGANGSGELGDGSTTARSTPVAADGPTNVVQVVQSSTGTISSCAITTYLTASGTVWQSSGSSRPQIVGGLTDIISIAAGGCHTLALDAKGGVWAWGTGIAGQIGNGNTANTATPVKVLDGAASIGAGYAHSFAAKTDGSLWAWGANGSGQLGIGNTSDRSSPTEVPTVSGIRAVSGGFASSYALDRKGRAWSWGNNEYGELGLGDTTARTSPQQITTLGQGTTAGLVRNVIGAGLGAAALMADGTVRAWGVNNLGQLGNATAAGQSSTPIQIPNLQQQTALAGGWATWASADAAGKVTVWGSTASNQRADGTNPATSTPATAGINISPYRLPWKYTLGTRDATGRQTTTTVDRLGNPHRTRPGRGHAVVTAAFDTVAGYDAADRQTWSITPSNRDGAKVSTTEYDNFGNPTRAIDARGNATRTTFDAVNRQLTTQTTRPSAEAPSTCTASATSAAFTTGQNGQKICVTSSTYDGLDHEITTTDANSQVSQTTYDATGRTIRQTTPRNDGTYTSLDARWRYDADGNMVDACSPRQFAAGESNTTTSCTSTGVHSTHMTLDRAGRVVNETKYRAGSPTTTLTTGYGYDADGNPTSVTDPNSHTTTATFDLQGRKLTETKPRSTGKSNTTRWNYDKSGNVTAVRAPGSLNTGSGVDGSIVIDGTSASGSTDGIVHGAANPFKIPDGAQYRNVTLQNGARVTSNNANGLMFHVADTLTVCATCVIDMSGKGYKGGVAGTNAENPNTGTAPGNGGIAGASGLNGAGGGGGGHKSAGGAGNGAPGGLASGDEDFATVGTNYISGSGGGGGGGGSGLLAAATNGGDGGGYVRITADKIVVAGKIDATGRSAIVSTGNAGGGGGGAGGGIWLAASTIDLAEPSSVDVSGGTGGGPPDRKGGNGSDGRIRLDADTVTNTPTGVDGTRAAMITAYSYDAANRVVDTVEGAQTGQADPADESGPVALPDANGFANTRSRTVYDADGQPAAIFPPQAFSDAASLTDPKANTARRVDYDLDGRQTAVYSPRYDSGTTSVGDGNDGDIANNDQQVTQCAPDRRPDAVEGAKSYSSTAGVCVARTVYDANDNIARQWLPTSSGNDNRYVDYTYTPDNLASKVTAPDPNSSGRVDAAQTRYDGVGRPVRVQDAMGNVNQTSYTGDGLTKQTTSQSYTVASTTVTQSMSYSYDANGNTKTTTNGAGAVTTDTWTTDNLLASLQAPGASGTVFNTTRYGYDNVGNPTSVLMPQQEATSGPAVINRFTDDNLLAATDTPITANSYRSVRYSYSPAGWKVSTESARCNSGSLTNCTPGNSAWDSAGSMRLTYGANGRVADQIGRDKTSISTSYDPTGSPKTVTDPISGFVINASYYLDGALRVADDGRNENTYAYDASGKTTVRTDKTGATGVTGGSKTTTTYAYNDAGLVAKSNSGVLADSTTYNWDDAGRLVKEQTDDHYNELSWNPDDTLAGFKTTAGGSAKAEFGYRYNNNGDIIKQTATGAETYTNDYTYTPGRNLASWTRGTTTKNYSWDRNNNRTSDGTTTTTYRLDNSINAVGSKAHTYDRVGLLTNDGCQAYIYDDFDRVRKVTSSGAAGCAPARVTEYTYDGLDRQRTMSVSDAKDASGAALAGANGATSSVFDGMTTSLVGQVNAINGSNSKPKTLYQLRASGDAMALKQDGAAPSKSYLDSDGHGNITTQVNTGDAVSCAVAYDPYGIPVSPASSVTMCKSGTDSGTTANTHWYRGQARDGSTGDYQLGARTYDPDTGTFTAPDSYRVADSQTDLSVGTDPLTANTYAYVNGNPINLSDPDGHFQRCSEEGNLRCDKPPASEDAWQAHDEYLKEQLSENKVQRAKTKKKADESFDWVGVGGQVLGDVTGITDIKNCVMEGDVQACLWSVSGVGLAALTKAGKTVKGIKALDKSYKTFKRGKASLRGVLRNLDAADDDLRAALKISRGSKAASPVARSSKAVVAKRTGADATATARKLGREGESSAKIVKNKRRIPSSSGTAAYRIPDELNASVLGEVKNVKSLGWSSQLRDFYDYALDQSLEFKLYVRPSTVFRGQLDQLHQAGRVTRVDVPGMGPR